MGRVWNLFNTIWRLKHFLNKVSQLYGKANNEQLNSSISIISETMFTITDEFPTLTRQKVPVAISNINYEILLSELNEFESEESIEEVIKNKSTSIRIRLQKPDSEES